MKTIEEIEKEEPRRNEDLTGKIMKATLIGCGVAIAGLNVYAGFYDTESLQKLLQFEAACVIGVAAMMPIGVALVWLEDKLDQRRYKSEDKKSY